MNVRVTGSTITGVDVNFTVTNAPEIEGSPSGKIIGTNNIAGGLTIIVPIKLVETEVGLNGVFQFPLKQLGERDSTWKFSLTISNQTALSQELTVA